MCFFKKCNNPRLKINIRFVFLSLNCRHNRKLAIMRLQFHPRTICAYVVDMVSKIDLIKKKITNKKRYKDVKH